MITSFIGLRYLKGSGFTKVVTWFSFLGIALGVATLIIVTSVMNGFRSELLDKIVGMNGHIEVSTYGDTGIANYNGIRRILQKNRNLSAIIATVDKQTILLAQDNARGIVVNGISIEDLKQKKIIASNIKSGNISNFYENVVFIGTRLAETMALKLGDTVRCLIPDGLITAFGTVPKEEEFKVAGIFEAGMNDYDKNVILMPLSTAQDFFNINGKISKFELFVREDVSVNRVTSELLKTLPRNLRILDWQHADAGIFHAVVVEKNVMSLILSIIILVAAFNIISGLTMLTSNKTRDIAILRTVGMTKHSILKIFLYIGSTIGVFGTGLGLALGLAVSLNIEKIKNFLEKLTGNELFSEEVYFLSQLPVKINPVEILFIAIFSLLMCFLATIYPAKKASALNPVDALRF